MTDTINIGGEDTPDKPIDAERATRQRLLLALHEAIDGLTTDEASKMMTRFVDIIRTRGSSIELSLLEEADAITPARPVDRAILTATHNALHESGDISAISEALVDIDKSDYYNVKRPLYKALRNAIAADNPDVVHALLPEEISPDLLYIALEIAGLNANSPSSPRKVKQDKERFISDGTVRLNVINYLIHRPEFGHLAGPEAEITESVRFGTLLSNTASSSADKSEAISAVLDRASEIAGQETTLVKMIAAARTPKPGTNTLTKKAEYAICNALFWGHSKNLRTLLLHTSAADMTAPLIRVCEIMPGVMRHNYGRIDMEQLQQKIEMLCTHTPGIDANTIMTALKADDNITLNQVRDSLKSISAAWKPPHPNSIRWP